MTMPGARDRTFSRFCFLMMPADVLMLDGKAASRRFSHFPAKASRFVANRSVAKRHNGQWEPDMAIGNYFFPLTASRRLWERYFFCSEQWLTKGIYSVCNLWPQSLLLMQSFTLEKFTTVLGLLGKSNFTVQKTSKDCLFKVSCHRHRLGYG